MGFAILATYVAIQQTKKSRRPLKSVYVWMIWVELVACVIIALECLLYLLYIIQPSFYFFMSILFLWATQIHLLLQIIINRIRVILHDQRKGRAMVIGVALFIVCINISVFCIWIPARLEISQRYFHINNVWDRVEKVLYLFVDGCLNWYFIRTVKQNLVANGLQKYNRLVRFNQRIIVVSLSMDVMIIGAMSIPNGFLYAMFHPLAFLVKLNIEMTMANLIRKIALENQNQNSFLVTFVSHSTDSARPEICPTSKRHRWSISSLVDPKRWSRQPLHEPEDGIIKTEEFSVISRRRSQLSSNLCRGSSQKTWKREDSLALEETSVRSDVVPQTSRDSTEHATSRDSAVAGDDVVLVPPPAVTRHLENE
ncbi:uncharacterized protein N0V89_007454 [Didymosphaeria variabile]|uniref:Uncharacterized protein n=1 Tax=Didymosphaeria variabile TaxID=1932322 RepID=A0A9W8XIW6_9PLEO|nr:uncharacterized protein N0V89_007454 [Didymosphaeria variabile]KAJ4352108.1 hypothetical protein N0V89_007454 [Didymosphaeria variabile]